MGYKLFLRTLILLVFGLFQGSAWSQSVELNGGVIIKAQIFLGNQNQGIKIGVSGVGSLNAGNFAMEGGVSLYNGYVFGRHTTRVSGYNSGYDAFLLAGYGRNQNLLVSTLIEDVPVLHVEQQDACFYGLGFGVEKEFLPGKLNVFDQRLGKLLMRFSQDQHSFNFAIKNDVRSGNTFLGEGTDFGNTGQLEMTYFSVRNHREVLRLGVGILLFTARPDYSRTPNNALNSDDGSKNVWHTLSPFHDLFYGNMYVLGGFQQRDASMLLKFGINSQKTGAWIQNTLHDSFGLNPRFPWDVSSKDKFFYEAQGTLFKTIE